MFPGINYIYISSCNIYCGSRMPLSGSFFCILTCCLIYVAEIRFLAIIHSPSKLTILFTSLPSKCQTNPFFKQRFRWEQKYETAIRYFQYVVQIIVPYLKGGFDPLSYQSLKKGRKNGYHLNKESK